MHSDFDSVLRNHCGNYTILLPQCHMMLRNCYDIKNFHGGYVTQREYVPGKPKAVGLVVRSEKNKDISFLSWGGLGGRHFLRNMIFFKKNLMGMLHVSSTEHSSLICLLVWVLAVFSLFCSLYLQIVYITIKENVIKNKSLFCLLLVNHTREDD